MTKDLILKLIPGAKHTCVVNQKYELASNFRQLEKDIKTSTPCEDGLTYEDRYNKLISTMDEVIKHKDSLVGDSYLIGEDLKKDVLPLIEDAEKIRSQCAELMKTAAEMERAAFDLIRKAIPELQGMKGLALLKETGKVVITGND